MAAVARRCRRGLGARRRVGRGCRRPGQRVSWPGAAGQGDGRVGHLLANNTAAIADYAARWDHGEIISTAFAESTVDLVVSRRFAKKQPMQWSKKGAHLLLQTRSRTLDGTLRDLFTTWYPAMPANDVQPLPLAAAA